MTLKKISSNDITKGLNRAGITGEVYASQALEATRLFIQSELPQARIDDLEPVAVRSGVLIIRSTNPAAAQRLKEREDDLLEYVSQASGVKANRLQFRV